MLQLICTKDSRNQRHGMSDKIIDLKPRLRAKADELAAFFLSSRRRHTRLTCDWSSDVCSSDLYSEQWSRLCLGPKRKGWQACQRISRNKHQRRRQVERRGAKADPARGGARAARPAVVRAAAPGAADARAESGSIFVRRKFASSVS